MSTQRMTRRAFPDLLADYNNATNGTWPEAFRFESADRLPLDEYRAGFRYIDGAHGPEWIRASWVASIEDAARELDNLVTIHDKGGTASSPKKIKNAARELLRLLGEA